MNRLYRCVYCGFVFTALGKWECCPKPWCGGFVVTVPSKREALREAV